MKKTSKRLSTAILTAMIIAGVQMTAFATADTSLANESSAPDASGQEAVIQEYASADESAAAEGALGTAGTTGNINESPNTGAAVAPFAVAMLAAACIPVILKTRK